MQIPFGEWLPDQPNHLKNGANIAKNVYHAKQSYKPVKSLVAYSSNDIVSICLGAGSFRDGSNSVFNFVATNSDIFQLTSGTFTSRKSSLTGDSTDYFTFTQFGNYVIVSNGVDAPQYYLMGTSTNFADLSSIATEGTPPTFRVSGVIRDFLVTGSQPTNTNRVQWSGINDIGTWTSGSKQADFQDLPGSGGQIVHITSGEVGYVFRQNQIIRMDFVGGSTIFRFSVISSNRGAVYGRTVTQNDRNIFFYSDDGFYQINGDTLIPIGAEKVNRHFDNDLNKAYTDRISAAVDPFNQLAIWSYVSKRSTNGIPDSLLIYNYVTQKWTYADEAASTIFTQFFGAYTVETMDVISQNLEDINMSLDTDFWLGGQLYLGAIDNNFKAAIFSGKPLDVEIETDELEAVPGKRINIIGVRPIVDADTTVTIKTREKLSNTPVESIAGITNASGLNPVRASGRYVRANVKVSAGTDWNHAQGIDIIGSEAGTR
jgi:hypothetical protein